MSKRAKGGKEEKGEKDTKVKAQVEELIQSGLEAPGLTPDRTGYAYLRLNLQGKSLDSMHNSVANYKHICYVDLSNNNLVDFTVFGQLPNLIDLNLKKNSIKDLKSLANEEAYPALQNLDLSENKVVDLGAIKCPKLLQLNLSENRIDKGENFDGHPKLILLDLRKNRISNTTIIKSMPNLIDLYLSENKVKALGGLDGLGALKNLHLNSNNLEILGEETFPALESLEYLNLSENNVGKMEEILKLKELPKLRTLIFSFNPIITNMGNQYFYDTLIAMPNLAQINEFEINNNLRQKTWNYQEDKWKVEEEAKRLAEEEERRKEEQEAQNDQ